MLRMRFPSVEELSALPVTFRATVGPEWIDVMGHMNVAWYTHAFSNAVGGLLSLMGTRLEDSRTGQVGTVALEVHVHYLSELREGQVLRVHSRLLGCTEKRFHAISFLVNETAERLSATSEGVGSYFDLRARRTAPMPPDVAARTRGLLAEHAALPWPAPVLGTMGA